MFKFIIPIIIVFIIILFWEKITNKIYKKFKIQLNYLIVSAVCLGIAIIILLLNN
jgi:hypothetical protein